MISRIIDFSIRRRWFVLLAALAACGLGAWALARIPIDAVPDITNNQVQINTVAPALSPVEIEKQVTFRIETALAGTPGLEYTRSLSRNGFSQVTAVFSERTNIYFARQQINERLLEVRNSLPPGAEPKMGPISTGLGEIYMWTVEYAPRRESKAQDGRPGWQSDGTYLTPEGQRLESELERAAYLRTVQDWIIRPQLKSVPGVAGVDAIGGYVKQYHVQPDPAKLIALGLSFGDIARAIEANNLSRGATTIEQNGEGYVVRATGRVETTADIADIAVATRASVPIRVKDIAEVKIGAQTAHRQRQREGRGGGRGNGADADRRQQPHRGRRGRRQDRRDQPHAAARHRDQDRAQPHGARRCHHRHGRDQSRGRRAAGDRRAVPAAGKFPRRPHHRRS